MHVVRTKVLLISALGTVIEDPVRVKDQRTFTRAHTHTHTHTNTHTQTRMQTHMHKHAHTDAHKHTQTHMHKHTHACTNTHTHAHKHTHFRWGTEAQGRGLSCGLAETNCSARPPSLHQWLPCRVPGNITRGPTQTQ